MRAIFTVKTQGCEFRMSVWVNLALKLTCSRCFAFANWLQNTDAAAGLQ